LNAKIFLVYGQESFFLPTFIMPTKIDGQNFYTVKEAAIFIEMNEITLRGYIRKGLVQTSKINGVTQIAEAEAYRLKDNLSRNRTLPR
jgi:hypothetical protein